MLLVVGVLLMGHSVAHALSCSDNPDQVGIRYLGVAALDIHYKNQRVLTDPFYTPFSMWDIATLSKYKSDANAIDEAIGPFQQNVNAVLIGHGHYDHLADLPAIKNYLTPDSLVVGSETSINMVAPSFDIDQLLPITNNNTDVWFYIADGWIRIKAEASEHAPQIWNINLFPGNQTAAQATLPQYIWNWKQGLNLTFLIDFLESPHSENVFKRMYFQSSASSYPIGHQPIQDDIPVDVAWLAGASFDHVDDYPDGILKNYQPKHTLFIHWENFFKPWLKDPTPLMLINIDKLMGVAADAHDGLIEMAQPNECIRLQ